MVDEDKLRELKDRIETAESSNTPITKQNKESGAGFGFKISTEIIAALVVGVGIGLIVDKYLGTKPFGLIIFFISLFICIYPIITIYKLNPVKAMKR